MTSKRECQETKKLKCFDHILCFSLIKQRVLKTMKIKTKILAYFQFLHFFDMKY